MTEFSARLATTFGLACLLAGCITGPEPSMESAAAQVAPKAVAGPDEFPADLSSLPVRAKDRLDVRVLREPDLSLENVRVDEDGTFDMPYIGRVTAEGRTAREIAFDIQERLGKEYLVNPRVAVNVVDYGSNLVTVEGAVVQSGIYQFQPDTTLMGAIALARGPTRLARLREVAIFRKESGTRSVAVFDLQKVRSGEMIDPILKPGDRVLVGFNGLTQAWQDFLQTVPLIGLFTRF